MKRADKQPGLLDSIRTALLADKRSLRAIAEAIESDAGQLSRFARGERMLEAATLDRLANVLGVVVKLPRARPDKRS